MSTLKTCFFWLSPLAVIAIDQVLFCRCSHFQTVLPLMFCYQPLQYIKSYLENMHRSNDRTRFLMLEYMSINRMEIFNDKNPQTACFLNNWSCATVILKKENQKPIASKGHLLEIKLKCIT